ncbi:MAG: hypothetical protein AAFN44_03385 [Pseudomonadota bacterium]
MNVIAIHRDVFSFEPKVYKVKEGATLADMAKRVSSLPEGWPRHDGDTICINGHPVPRAVWGMVKPKPISKGVKTEVTFHAPPEGDDGGKVLGLVASIGLIALSGGIASGAVLGGLTGATAGKATLLSTALSLAVKATSALALSALAPPPVSESGPSAPEALGRSSLDGNALQPNVPLPRVCGTMRIFPPYVCSPIVYYDRDDEIVEGVAAMAGPHLLEDIRMADAPVGTIDGLEIQTRPGFSGDAAIDLVTQYGFTENVNQQLGQHKLDDNNRFLDPDFTAPLDATPKFMSIGTRGAPDSIQLDFSYPNGSFWNGDDVYKLRVPFRIKMRQKGTTTWTDLPEIHFVQGSLGEVRFSIKFVFQNGQQGRGTCGSHPVGFMSGYAETGAQGDSASGGTVGPAFARWMASSYFTGSGSDDLLSDSSASTTRVYNTDLSEFMATFYLDTATFPKGEYEFRIKRGYTCRDVDFNASSYELFAVKRDFFFYQNNGVVDFIFVGRDQIMDRIFLVRSTIFYNAHPVQQGGNALIAIKAKNVQLNRMSVIASGYVYNWDGSGWNTLTTTSNPAVHLRDVLEGNLTAVPIPNSVIDNDSLVAFRQHCITNNHRINAIMQDTSFEEAAQLCAAAGFGQTYQSEVYGVIWDYDRSAEAPVQVFSDRNLNNFSWSKGFPTQLDGFRITFRDADRDYRQRQIIYPPGATITEQVNYVGPVRDTQAEERAQYDLDVLRYRSVFYSWTSPALAIKCRRGSLVGLNVDFLEEHYASARVMSYVINASGNVFNITLDTEIEPINGINYGVVLVRANGTQSSHRILFFDGQRIRIETSFAPNGLATDDLAIIGEFGSEMRRVIVSDMQPLDRLNWQITAVPEAPEIFQ